MSSNLPLNHGFCRVFHLNSGEEMGLLLHDVSIRSHLHPIMPPLLLMLKSKKSMAVFLYIYISLSTIKSMFVRQKPHVPLISTCDVPRPWQGKNPSCCSLLKKGDASSRAAANPSAAACGTKENKIKK